MAWSKRQIKRLLIILGFIFLNIIIIYGIGQLMNYFNSGAERESTLHITLEDNTYYTPKISWKPLHNEGRALNDQTQKDIEKDYLNAWFVKNYALKENDTIAFLDFYTSSAQKKLSEAIVFNSSHGIHTEQTTIAHELEIHFFSEDGQLVYFTDHNVPIYESTYENNRLITQTANKTSYEVVMLLEDGFWRIRHKKAITTAKYNSDSATSLTKIEENIKGINYYPKDTPWLDFWSSYDKNIIENDFQIIKRLNLNTIRIFLPYEAFSEALFIKNSTHLTSLLNLAEANQINVIPTFFDFYGNYAVLDYSLCDRYLERIITHIKGHPAIIQYDIKNEPDLDFNNYGKDRVLQWLQFIVHRTKHYDNNTPVTIGWSQAKHAIQLKDEVDVVSFHYYKKPKDFITTYTWLKNNVKKPIVLQEYGTHSYNSFWFPFSKTENAQADYYKSMNELLDMYNISSLSWTLYDFPEIDHKIFGRLPWKVLPQKHYGIIDVDGNDKPAAHPESTSTNSIHHINKFHTFILICFICILFIYKKRTFVYRCIKTIESKLFR